MLTENEKKQIVHKSIADIHNLYFLGDYIENLKTKKKRISTPYWFNLDPKEKIKTKLYKFDDDGYKTNINILYSHEELYDNLEKHSDWYLSYRHKITLLTIFQIFLKLLNFNLLFALSFSLYLFITEDKQKTVLHPYYVKKLEKKIYIYIDKLLEHINKNESFEDLFNRISEINFGLDKNEFGCLYGCNQKCLERILKEINNLNPNLFLVIANKNNADVIIKKRVIGQIPDIHIKKNNLAVECSVDNSVFCFGNIDTDSKIIEIVLSENGDISVVNSQNKIIFIH